MSIRSSQPQRQADTDGFCDSGVLPFPERPKSGATPMQPSSLASFTQLDASESPRCVSVVGSLASPSPSRLPSVAWGHPLLPCF